MSKNKEKDRDKERERRKGRSRDEPDEHAHSERRKKRVGASDDKERKDKKRDKNRDGDKERRSKKSKKSEKESTGISLENINGKARNKTSSKSQSDRKDENIESITVLGSVDSPLARSYGRLRQVAVESRDEEKRSNQGSFTEEPKTGSRDEDSDYDEEAGEGGEGDQLEEDEEEEKPKRDFGTIFKDCLNNYCGTTIANFLVRKRFVLYRLFLCVAYYVLGVEFYHFWEGWSRSDCVYFITVSTTTVGYGDLFPTDDDSRLFTIFYVIFGIIVVLDSANQVIQYFVVKKTQRYILQCVDACVRFYYRNFKNSGEVADDSHGTSLNTTSLFKIGFSFLLVLGMIAGGTVYFMAAESFSLVQALYWTVCTMLTIGYGDLNIERESTRFFLTWFIWLCVIVYVIAITNIVSTFEDLKADALRYEILRLHAVDIVDVLDEAKRVDKQEQGDGKAGAVKFFQIRDHTKDIHELRSSMLIESGDLGEEAESGKHKHKQRGRHQKNAKKNGGGLAFDDIYSSQADDFLGGGVIGPAVSVKVKFDDLNETVNVTATDIKEIVDRAKEDRFVLEMLMKMKKVDQLQDVDVLVKHFRKVENLRNMAVKGNASRDEVIEKLEAEEHNQKTMLGGITKNYLLANNNALRKQKEQAGGSGRKQVRQESVLEKLRRGSATPHVSKVIVNDELQRRLLPGGGRSVQGSLFSSFSSPGVPDDGQTMNPSPLLTPPRVRDKAPVPPPIVEESEPDSSEPESEPESD